MSDERAFGYEAAVLAIQGSDERWRLGEDAAHPQFRRVALERFGRALAFVLDTAPWWVETVTFPGPGSDLEIEVRVLTPDALLVVSTPWVPEEDGLAPTVRIRPLRLLQELEVDGFVHAEDGTAVGCTITLLFGQQRAVRLGASPGVDRTVLAGFLPRLRSILDG